MREIETEKVIAETINNTPVGKKISIQFSGMTSIVDVHMTFSGGWVISQTIIPGKALEFIRGEDGYLESVDITITPYDGIQSCDV